MQRNKAILYTTTFLSGVLMTSLMGSLAFAADAAPPSSAAVSAFNGKLEFGGGWADSDLFSSDEAFYGAGSISMPLGESFGLQIDGAVKDVFGETFVGGAGHLFMRDPQSYLFGAIGGAADMGAVDIVWGGGEAEFYLNNISLELAAGYMNVNPDSGSNDDDAFAFADLAFYATENLRFAVGGSSVAGFETGHLTAEYMFSDMPFSIKAEGRVGEDDFVSGTLGFSFYFGGDDSSKSLMRRHREDDPKNRVLDIFGSAAAAGFNEVGPNTPTCPQYYYYVDGEGCVPQLG